MTSHVVVRFSNGWLPSGIVTGLLRSVHCWSSSHSAFNLSPPPFLWSRIASGELQVSHSTGTFSELVDDVFTVADSRACLSSRGARAKSKCQLPRSHMFVDLSSGLRGFLVADRLAVAFVTAAGYASAGALFDVGDPVFVRGGYTIGQFDVRSLPF